MGEETPKKYHPGNTFIYEPSGRIHFLNVDTYDYYWTAMTKHLYSSVIPEGVKDYFGFQKGINELYYYSSNSPPERINCEELEAEIVEINEGRMVDEKFKFGTHSSTFWIDFDDGTVYTQKQDVEGMSLDLVEIERRDYQIWTNNKNKKRIDIKFSQFIKCLGPCLCKPHGPHTEDDYVGDHAEFRQTNIYHLEFREYTDLIEFEKTVPLPSLPKDDLIVYFDKPVDGYEKVYQGLYQGGVEVVAKDMGKIKLEDIRRLSDRLHELSKSNHFLRFFGFKNLKGNTFFIFESFAFNSTQESKFDGTWTQRKLFKNLRGLIKGLGYMVKMAFTYGKIQGSNVVVVGKGENQTKMKLWVHELGLRSKQKKGRL